MKILEIILQFFAKLFGVKEEEPPVVSSGTTGNTDDAVVPTTGETENTITDQPDENQEEPNMNHEEIEKIVKDFAAEASHRKVDQIAIHCTATKEGTPVTVDEIDVWHKNRGFSKQKISGRYCGYHFVIALDGEIMCGRDLREVGAHVSGYNSNSIGICYVGGLDKNGKAKDTRTDEQKEALIWLITLLKHTLSIDKVQGHRDYSPDKNGNGIIEPSEYIKSCPCFDAIPEYKDI